MVVASSSPTASRLNELNELAALTGYQDESAPGKTPASLTKDTESNGESNPEEVKESSEGEALLDPEDLMVDDATPQRLCIARH